MGKQFSGQGPQSLGTGTRIPKLLGERQRRSPGTERPVQDSPERSVG